MSVRKLHIVPEQTQKLRLSDYVHFAFPEIGSRKGGKKAIKRNEVKVNEQPATTGIWVKPGMKISWHPSLPSRKPYHKKLPVLFEDDHLAVIHKPAGMYTSGNQFKTLENAAIFNLKASSEMDALKFPRPVHRLDAQTQGLVIFAKSKYALIQMGKQFEERRIEKQYRAITIGKMPATGIINDLIEGKPAETVFKTVRITRSLKCKWLTTADLFPKTGRTHQIRKHLSGIGHPILGDKEYGMEGLILKNKGLFLCATGLSFDHPVSKNRINLYISPPIKFYKRISYEQYRYRKYPK